MIKNLLKRILSIFGKKKKVADEEWDEKRIDVVGSNGNDGLHYDNLTK